MIDIAHFHPELRVFNKQCQYFLMGVDTLSQKMACIGNFDCMGIF